MAYFLEIPNLQQKSKRNQKTIYRLQTIIKIQVDYAINSLKRPYK